MGILLMQLADMQEDTVLLSSYWLLDMEDTRDRRRLVVDMDWLMEVPEDMVLLLLSEDKEVAEHWHHIHTAVFGEVVELVVVVVLSKQKLEVCHYKKNDTGQGLI